MDNGNQSTYFFVGRLSSLSSRFQVQQERLLNGFYLEIYMHGIAIWGSTSKTFLEVYPEVKDTLDTILAAYVFKTKRPLSYIIESWIETQENVTSKNMVGWMLRGDERAIAISRRSKLNTPWRKAALFYRGLSQTGNINHRLAMKDYYQAILDAGDDAFLFAYRSIEDICRAITGASDLGRNDWDRMHQLLGTTKVQIDPLTDVAKCVRHGDKTNPTVKAARSNRSQLINVAHEVILKEMERTFPKFVT